MVEKAGRIKLVGGGTFLDIASLVKSDQEERGLLSMAFSPNYAANGLFYVDYTDIDGDINVVEYTRSASNPNVADPGSARPVLFAEHSGAQYHHGGQLQFGPDGDLYVSIGDALDGHVHATSSDGPVYRLQDGAVSPCTLNNGQPVDTTPPTLNVAFSGVTKALRTHKLRVAMRCSEGCSITIGTRLKKVRTLRARHRDLAANQRAVVTLKLSKATVRKLRKRLKHHSSVRVSLAARATDAAGNSTTVHRGGRIRRHR